MEPILQLTTATFAPVICGVLTLWLPRRMIGGRVALALLGPIVSVALLIGYQASWGPDHGPVSAAWMPLLKLDLAYQPDHLGLFFALLVSGIGLLITLYARAYFGPDADQLYRFFPSLHLFMTAMIGVALADNFMLLLLFWEMTSISSFLLIGWERDDPIAVRKAMQAFVVTGLGGLVMMGGLILLGLHTGCWSFSELLAQRQNLAVDVVFKSAFVMVLVGALAKSAQVPFHFWLPGAMAAPTPVSAYLHSATMVKAGVYLTGRMGPILAGLAGMEIWLQLIVPLGALTMIYGAFIALRKTDLKQIFAYTTVSQLGLLMCMYGLSGISYSHDGHAQPNLIWDVTQILNHALYKAPLFILAGAIGHIAATRELPQLRGLLYRGRTEAIMTVLMLLAAYAMAAGPLTLSFTAKELFFYQVWHGYESAPSPWFWVLMAAGVGTGMFNVAIFVRLLSVLAIRPRPAAGHEEPVEDDAFDSDADENVEAELGHPADAHGHPHAQQLHHAHPGEHHETGLWPTFLWIPALAILIFQFLGGLAPQAFQAIFGTLEPSKAYFEHLPSLWELISHPGPPLLMSLFAVGLGVALGLAPLLRTVYSDPFDLAYPGFYTGVTKIIGPGLFGLVQRGHAGAYVAFVFLALVGLFIWSVGVDLRWLTPPMAPWLEDPTHPEMRLGILLTAIVCLAAILLPCLQQTTARVLALGSCGFSVAGVYYLYKAPDLALTQISIEIVSLVLFLLVLSLLPRRGEKPNRSVIPRILLSVAVGLVAFWLTWTSSVGDQPVMPYRNAQGQPLAKLGEYFLRNSHHGTDSLAVGAAQLYGGVVDRGSAHRSSFGSKFHDSTDHHDQGELTLHKGGGGDNVVNVILVDFRGFDTMGEITVLGLAAMGVWTLLRRPRKQAKLAPTPRGPTAADESQSLAGVPEGADPLGTKGGGP